MDKTKKVWIWIGVVVVVIVIIVFAIALNKNRNSVAAVANEPVGTQTSLGTVTATGIVAASGTSAIASSGVVVAPTGKPTENNVAPASPSAPQQSNPIGNTAAIPSAAVKLTVSAASGFTPNSFTVSAGAPVTLAITGADTQVHVFAFEDPSLSAVAVGVGPGETRAITFNAPSAAGQYKFYSNVPGQSGETGVMIVK